MRMYDIIHKKRDGEALTQAEIDFVIKGFTDGSIPDYQMAALLMAVFFRGLDTRETTALTLAMRDSGDLLAFPADPRPLVDKHSTGGVGDKVSLPLAPLLACLGFRVPMISGRGLGHTGGTLECASQWGNDAIFDMVGNLDEWIEDPEGTFLGGFYARKTQEGCDSRVEVHGLDYYDYSLGVRCCKSP